MHTLVIYLSVEHKDLSWINNIDTNRFYIYVYSNYSINNYSNIFSNEIIYYSAPVSDTRVILNHIINNYDKLSGNLIFINSNCVNQKYIPEFCYKHIRNPFRNTKINVDNNCRPEDLLTRQNSRKKFQDWLIEFVDADYFLQFKKNPFCIFFDEFVVPSAFIHSRSVEYYRNLLSKSSDYEFECNIKKSWYYIFNIHKVIDQ